GGGYGLALLNNGTVWAWGNNASGQLGNGTTTNSTTAAEVSGPTGLGVFINQSVGSAIAIAAGANHSLAVLIDGTVWAWGDNSDGELGNGTTTSTSAPVQV